MSDVVALEVLDGYRLWVRFDDGVEGEVDMSQLVRSPRAGVFGCWPTRTYLPRHTLSMAQ